MNQVSTIRFATTRRDFSSLLNLRVNEYFKDNALSKHANLEMIIKTVFMFSLYFVPYALLMSGIISSGWLAVVCVVLMSLGLAGIGLAVMHDANHGAYSKKN